LNALELCGNAFVAQTGGASTYYYQRTNRWECVLIKISDHFGDGWETAELTVETPDGVQTKLGDIDNYEARCDIPNPLTFRYCPKDGSEIGKYRFSIKNGVTAKPKFHWEILWRIFEERTGTWHIGK
jgi:hypothetical protein